MLITAGSVTYTLAQEHTEPTIQITQQKNSFDITVLVPENSYIPDENLELDIVGKGVTLSSVFFPDTELFEERDVFFNNVAIKAIVEGTPDANFTIRLSYQSCSKQHVCSEFLIFKRSFKVAADEKAVKTSVKSAEKPLPVTMVSEQDGIAEMLKKGSLLLTLVTFFGFGLLLAFTPCMLPMIPILSSVIVCKQEHMNTQRGFFLSLTYVLSMAVVYALAGVLAASFGHNIQVLFQETWIIIFVSALFLLLSLSMFGVFNIEMPKMIQAFFSKTSASSQHRTYFGVAILGVFSALIVGPCVAPPLAGALIYIGQTGDELLGGLSLFVMSLGMGLPLLVLGAGAGKFLPKPGPWMYEVKFTFGFVMIGFAIWILSRILEGSVILMMWGLLLIAIAVYMNLFESKNLAETEIFYKLKKLLALLSLIFGIILIVGSIGGASSIKAPLAPFTAKAGYSATPSRVVFKTISSEHLLATLQSAKRPVMVLFTADWCGNCVALKEEIFTQQDVVAELAVFEKIEVDMTASTDADLALLKQYGLFGPPALLFYDRNHKELVDYQIVGYKEKAPLLAHISQVKKLL